MLESLIALQQWRCIGWRSLKVRPLPFAQEATRPNALQTPTSVSISHADQGGCCDFSISRSLRSRSNSKAVRVTSRRAMELHQSRPDDGG